jgi:hypothetical protein
MHRADAFTLGLASARPGFFFDGMELLATLSVDVGGLDVLRPALPQLWAVREEVEADLATVTALCTDAWRTPVQAPTAVDAYRSLLTDRVFEIVNRWSYIADIHTVNRLQAWFYAGFGCGRGQTVLRGVALRDVLVAQWGARGPLASMDGRLGRMAAEAARQLDVAAREDDLSAVRPLFLQGASVLDALSVRLLAADPAVPSGRSEDAPGLALLQESGDRVRRDLAAEARRR